MSGGSLREHQRMHNVECRMSNVEYRDILANASPDTVLVTNHVTIVVLYLGQSLSSALTLVLVSSPGDRILHHLVYVSVDALRKDLRGIS